MTPTKPAQFGVNVSWDRPGCVYPQALGSPSKRLISYHKARSSNEASAPAARMKLQPNELPREVAREFLRATRDYFAETDPHKRGAIAVHQLNVLRQYDKKLRLSHVEEMFEQMKGQ
jgi:hypothetical protein